MTHTALAEFSGLFRTHIATASAVWTEHVALAKLMISDPPQVRGRLAPSKEHLVDAFVLDKAAIGHGLTVFMGFFAVMNPIANTPIFLSLTAGDDDTTRRMVAFRAMVAAFVIIAVFCLLGSVIFSLFGITLPAFRVTGGVLVALIGFQMLHSNPSAVHHPSTADVADSRATALSVAFTPLALPILAGPGTIATAMNFASTGGAMNMLVTLGAFALLCAITYGFFVFGEGLTRYLGKSGLAVITRIMGLILAVIGVQMLIEGVEGAFPALSG